MSTSKRRTMIGIVLESADPALVEAWCGEGKLPVMYGLRQRGAWMRLSSPSYISSGCAWPTLNTGTTPARHGIGFFHREIKNGTYRTIKKYADQVHGEPFWMHLGRAGYRSAIFDLATTRPTADINGVIVVDWGSEHPSWKRSSYPEDLIRDILRDVGPHPLTDWYQGGLKSKEDYRQLADRILDGVDLRTRVLQYVLDKGPFDFVFCNYSEPHWAGHMFWHMHDPRHPEHVAEHLEHCGDVILQTYEACDRAIGRLAAAYPDADFVVLSNIGMGSHAGGDMMAAQVLDRLGVGPARSAKGPLQRLKRSMFRGAGGPIGAVQRVERLVTPGVIVKLKRLLPERLWDSWTRRILGLGNGWPESLAFLLPGDNSSLIRINRIGREPRGRVAPGAEFDKLCAELASAFMELVDPNRGEAAVEKVVILRDQLQGDRIDHLPDLAVVWKNFGAPIEALESPRIGRVLIPEYNKRSGGHLHEGFLIGAGPSFRQGVCLETKDVMDIAPTILAIFGVEVPEQMEGRIIADALADPAA